MTHRGTLKLTTQTDREIVLTRDFDAPRELVFDALTKPELIVQWLLGPTGWSMPVCEIDLRVGGAFRYVWRHHSNGTEMGIRGVYREILPPERLEHTESFDQSWYPGEAVTTSVLIEQDGGTMLRSTIRYESRQARDVVLESGVERRVEASYDRLDELLATRPSPGSASPSL